MWGWADVEIGDIYLARPLLLDELNESHYDTYFNSTF